MQTMHLFAGGGGGLLSDLILGHNPIIAVEWEPYACQILRERAADGWFPDLQVWEGDVRLFDPSEYTGRVDCIHAGFPCQDLSCAGKQAGLGEGTRSGLYREVLRIAGIVKPRYLFLENVSAIVNLGLGTVVADLSAMGYDCKWLTLRASDVGAPHHRDRWWCLAYSIDSADCTDRKQKGEQNEVSGISRQEGHAWLPNGTSNDTEVLADTNSAQCEGAKLSIGSAQEYSKSSKYGWWEVESRVDRVVDGVANFIYNDNLIQKNEVETNETEQFSQCGTENKRTHIVREMRSNESNEKVASTSQGQESIKQHDRESGVPLYEVSCEGASASRRTCKPSNTRSDMQNMRDEVYAKENSQSSSMQHRMYEDTWGNKRSEEVGEPYQNEAMRDMRDAVLIRKESRSEVHGLSWWEEEPEVGRVTTGCQHRAAQLKALGNGQVPLQTAVAFSILIK